MSYRSNQRTTMLERVRDLRKDSTEAEKFLWQFLRNRQVGNAKFRRQHQFGQFVLDFFCTEHSLAIEIDGSQHFTPEEARRDRARTAFLESKGVRLLRFTNVEVLTETNAVLADHHGGITAPLTLALSH